MVKKALSWILSLVMAFSMLVALSVTAVAYTGIYDNFDSGIPGTAPAGWSPYGSVVISNDVSVSPGNSVKLQGASGGAVSADKTIVVETENVVVVEADVYPGEGDAGSLSLIEGSHEWQARVIFKNEKIYYSSTGHDEDNLTEMSDYAANAWYHVKIVHDYTAKTFDVYIDDTLIGDDIAMYTSDDPTPKSLKISSGNDAGSKLIYFDNVRLYSAADETAPILNGYSVWRSDATVATVRFMPDENGSCYYQITDSETAPLDVVSGGTSGGSVTADTVATLSLTGLTSGAQYLHIVVEDVARNVSDPITVGMSCDYYYYENFEAYPLNTYIASNAMSPLAQRNAGTVSEDQKVIPDGLEKMLSLISNDGSASDQHVLLDASILAAADNYVFEGDVYPLLDSGFQLRFSFTDGSYEGTHEAGVFFNGGKITTATKSGSFTLKDSYTANEWHHIKIVADPSAGKYAVYVDDELLNDSLTLPSGINRLALSAGNLANGTTAYFDNLEFYLVPSVSDVRYAVTFNENYGDTPPTETYYIPEDTADFYDASTDGSIQTLTAPTRTGYVFGGWYKEAACTNQIMSADPVLSANTDYTDAAALWTKTEAVTLYAKWLEPTPSGLALDYGNEQINGLTADADYGISGVDVTADENGKAAIQSDWFGTDVSVVKKGVSANSSFDSAAAILAVPARPAGPTGLLVVEETATGAGDGKITGVSDTMEYKLSSASSWTAVVSGTTEITELDGGSYFVRYQAITSGSPAFASTETPITVGTTLHHGTIQFDSGSHGTYEGYNGWMIGVTRTDGSDGEVSVSYAMADGTAVAGTNYQAYSGTLTWADGDSSRKAIMFTSYNDSIYNGYLDLTCVLSGPTGGAVLGTQNQLNIQISDNDTPPTPEGLEAVAGNGKVSLSWDAVKDAFCYIVYYSTTDNDFTEDNTIKVYEGETCTITELNNGTKYYFAVKSQHNIYYSELSPSISAIPKASSSGGGSSSQTTYSITVISNDGGTITPAGTTNIDKYDSKTFTITPATGYKISDVLVDGKSIGVVSTYTFSSIVANHTIEAVFALDSQSKQFTDVDSNLWYREGIDFVLLNGLFNGTSDTTFEPNTNMTRAMLVTVLWRLENEPDVTVTELFADIANGTWYAEAVTWAAVHEIVKGYDEGTFGPDDPITRQQMASILYRYAIYKGYDVTAADDLSAFNDAGDISDWALAAMKWAVAEGLITGVSETELDSAGKASRAQVATILMRFVETVIK